MSLVDGLAELEIRGRDRDRGIWPAGLGCSASEPRGITTSSSTTCRERSDGSLQLLEYRAPRLHIRNGMCCRMRMVLSPRSWRQTAMIMNLES